ncbi:polyketide synthase [Brevibacillus dissolubilis]|uniref:polyketide synthase n=1 Tax=Brevibacillus dissolubilis TaxID=1844116 RepID=UPI003F660A66
MENYLGKASGQQVASGAPAPVTYGTQTAIGAEGHRSVPETFSTSDYAQTSSQANNQIQALTPALDEPFQPYHGDEVTLEIIDNQIAIVRMQDRVNKNMFSDQIVRGLMTKFDQIRRMPGIKAIIVTGYDKIFSMGGTPDTLHDIADKKANFTDFPFMYRGLLETEIPVIAAIQGHASGGGLLFGLYSDIVVMSEESVYTAVFMKFGFTPGMGATFILSEKLGRNVATEMMLTAKSFVGTELHNRGASVIFRPGQDVLAEALRIARGLADKPLHSLKVLKKELAGRILSQLPQYIERERYMHSETFHDPEVKQRIEFFLNPEKHTTQQPAPAPTPVPVQPAPDEVLDDGFFEQLLTELESGNITPDQAMELRKRV